MCEGRCDARIGAGTRDARVHLDIVVVFRRLALIDDTGILAVGQVEGPSVITRGVADGSIHVGGVDHVDKEVGRGGPLGVQVDVVFQGEGSTRDVFDTMPIFLCVPLVEDKLVAVERIFHDRDRGIIDLGNNDVFAHTTVGLIGYMIKRVFWSGISHHHLDEVSLSGTCKGEDQVSLQGLLYLPCSHRCSVVTGRCRVGPCATLRRHAFDLKIGLVGLHESELNLGDGGSIQRRDCHLVFGIQPNMIAIIGVESRYTRA